MADLHRLKPLRYRTVWISDVHLGTRSCKADYLLDFLDSVQCDYLYLVGDIVDFLAMQKGFYWPQVHNDVIRAILGKAKHGTRVVLVPGNHDELMRSYQGEVFGNIDIQRTVIHETHLGKRLLVIHGDEFDGMLKCPKITEWAGAVSYELLLFLNRIYNGVRCRMGKDYWSLSSYIKSRINSANRHIAAYENVVADYARKCGVDGVVCGHIHQPRLKQIGDIMYCNDGDWVEHCTALVESPEGHISLVYWDNLQKPMDIVQDSKIMVARETAVC